MPTLRELQAAFARALHGDASGAEAWVEAGGFAPERRLGIYRHNVDAIAAGYLRAAFPAVTRLGGGDYLEGLARDYRLAHPSRSGNLHDFGAGFADFLAAQLRETPYDFIADVAHLEWAYQDVLVAASARNFDLEAFLAIPPEAHETLVFNLAPSVRRVASRYPIYALWAANRAEDAEGTPIDLQAGGDCLLLYRGAGGAQVIELDAPTDAFVGALLQRASLGQAMAALEAVDPQRDPAAVLFELIQSGRIDGFEPA